MFRNREDAGRQLSRALSSYVSSDPVVIAIPRGGVVMGHEVARALHCPMDVATPRKLRSPLYPEVAIGAVLEDGEAVYDAAMAAEMGATPQYLRAEIAYQTAEVRRRARWLRDGRPHVNVHGRTVILVDDGIATGYTMWAAVRTLRRRQPKRLIVAVPVAAPTTLDRLHTWSDAIICLHQPDSFLSVGQFYQDFEQLTDAEVIDYLRRTTHLEPSLPAAR